VPRTATRHLVQVVDHQGVAHEVLTGDACLGNLQQALAVLGAQRVLDFAGLESPDRRCVADLHHVVLDPEIHWGVRAAVEDDRVPTGVTQLGTPEAASFRFAEQTRHRRLGANRMATSAREGRSCEDTRGEN
jgi:hypothetical protein